MKWLDETINTNTSKHVTVPTNPKIEPTPALAQSKKSLGHKEVENGTAVAPGN